MLYRNDYDAVKETVLQTEKEFTVINKPEYKTKKEKKIEEERL